MDYAELGFDINSQPLVKARDEMGRFVKKGVEADATVRKFGNTATVVGRKTEKFGRSANAGLLISPARHLDSTRYAIHGYYFAGRSV